MWAASSRTGRATVTPGRGPVRVSAASGTGRDRRTGVSEDGRPRRAGPDIVHDYHGLRRKDKQSRRRRDAVTALSSGVVLLLLPMRLLPVVQQVVALAK